MLLELNFSLGWGRAVTERKSSEGNLRHSFAKFKHCSCWLESQRSSSGSVAAKLRDSRAGAWRDRAVNSLPRLWQNLMEIVAATMPR